MKADFGTYSVITTVLYCEDSWEGAASLYEMMGIRDDENGRILKQYPPDYKLNLIDMDRMERPEVFKSCLQQIFGMIKLQKTVNTGISCIKNTSFNIPPNISNRRNMLIVV